MNFLSLFSKKTFSVSYIGQLRFYECLKTHKNAIVGATLVSCTLDSLIREVYNKKYTAEHSIMNYTLDEILIDIKKYNWIQDFKLLNDDDYKDIDNRYSVDFFPCNYFFTLAKSLNSKLNKSDYNIFLTTDLVLFDSSPTFKSIISNIKHTRKPTVYGAYFVENDTKLLVTRILIINRAAIELIEKNWNDALQQYYKETHDFKLRNEYATVRLFELSGIDNFQDLNFSGEIIRFRSNMDINDLTPKVLLAQQKEFSQNKKIFVTKGIKNGNRKSE